MAACCVATAWTGSAFGQGGATADGRGSSAPLQYESEDFWAEVHRWTGSDATRPRAQGPAERSRRRAPAGPAASPADDSRTVTTSATARANLRMAPDLTAAVVRSMPRNSVLRVFDEAPGGWFKVGETEPFGWVHETALQR